LNTFARPMLRMPEMNLFQSPSAFLLCLVASLTISSMPNQAALSVIGGEDVQLYTSHAFGAALQG